MNYFPLMPGDARVSSIDVQTPKHYLRVDFVPFFFNSKYTNLNSDWANTISHIWMTSEYYLGLWHFYRGQLMSCGPQK